jgi:hypothetical protein
VCSAPGTRHSSFGPFAARRILSEWRHGRRPHLLHRKSAAAEKRGRARFDGRNFVRGASQPAVHRGTTTVLAPGANRVLPSVGQRCKPA